ncbi:hypothetical protein [Tsukamurella soli]|uniref:SAF domain-containing protein n=1 Tax=Tsukamurella soli TaxID=644556 RepID=A0ABP8K2N9_9ACTN
MSDDDHDPAPVAARRGVARGDGSVARWGALVALLVVVVGLLYGLGASRPLPAPRFDGDRLGPEPGQTVADYEAVAAASLRAAPAGERRWALVSPVTEWTTDQTWAELGRVRVGRLLMRVPINGVQTPIVSVATGQSAAALEAANAVAATQVPDLVAPDARGSAIARVSAARFRAGTASVVGAVVWGTGSDLRSIAAAASVRTVQVVPDGGGRMAVAPLLPEFTTRVEPGADTGVVPAP